MGNEIGKEVTRGGRGGEDRLWTNVKYYWQAGEEERTGSGPILNINVRKIHFICRFITLKHSKCCLNDEIPFIL